LKRGEAGFGEIAQGFPLSLNHQRFLGYTTSRNVTVAQFLSDMFLPVEVAGPVILNFRTYPIRISNYKYICNDTGRHLTWADITSGKHNFTKYEGSSGPCYDDQEETTWEEVTAASGSPDPIFEVTSVTKLPRRCFTFSKQCLDEAITYNKTGHGTFVTVNFLNYVDHQMSGRRGGIDQLTERARRWLDENISDVCQRTGAQLALLGTGAETCSIVRAMD
jgi:hypothetical protein